LRQKPNSHLLEAKEKHGGIAVSEAALDDVFADDITVPSTDGYPLAATLFLPRGIKRHAVLINSATAVLRKIYRGFAGYLAHRGCAVLTYDYRGIGDSRQKSMEGYNQPKSLVGFKASMSDWAALDITAAVTWMRERYHNLPLGYVGHSFGGQVLGLLSNNREVSRASDRGPGRILEADGLARALPRLHHVQFRRHPPRPSARLRAGLERHRRGPAERSLSAVGPLGDEPALSVR
jgi:predicted alpha/beta hydrolase